MENLNKRPSKGILRFSEGCSRSNSVEKDIKWDEANIKETLHPDDKEYGHMKIDEPPTPFSRSPHGYSADNSDDEDLETKTNELLEKVSKKIKEPPLTIENVEGLDESVLDEIEQIESANENDESTSNFRRVSLSPTSSNIETSQNTGTYISDFELKRKRHYNEFHAVKLAKKLMQQELDAENDDDDESADNNKESMQ